MRAHTKILKTEKKDLIKHIADEIAHKTKLLKDIDTTAGEVKALKQENAKLFAAKAGIEMAMNEKKDALARLKEANLNLEKLASENRALQK
mmetsp:Transcript_29277/g.38990  ORF Transcript_29277/g.38990 Transcript_29277/m.38990 type:complete len:91 (+) Transcript_29277:108-380(+)|eukprot:CAMPEP_0185598718 /NCGR_PEP_ID=MMETSP0434-20130131/82194_1 /TAXON_ID=626734 ORGANISM="Favella taraikaensis, Strain Fe Narragansett Bay" /NCGR_SAMPLE_ID=MMETSP0434 /ASSEMBLY_ACC=CAM_ASM_000379 /LENGTH=90 /DNA_ID=CAMNT_0028227817 /DNA_START=46 /DNA_END=318 /DNA_ORIENTATION=-